MVDFDYARPRTLDEALSLLAAHPEARPLAGGQTLLPTLKQRLARPTLLVDLQALPELRGITIDDRTVTVGAMTRHAETASHTGLAAAIPALAFLAGGIAHPQVRHMGTMGGSISNNDPAADYPGALLALGATIRTNKRELAADDFITGMFETALERDEIVTAIHFPKPEKGAYAKFPNPASRYSMVGVFVAKTAGGVRVAVTGAGPCAFRWDDAEAALAASFAPAAIDGLSVDPGGLNGDMHGSAEYRAHLIKVMAKRAVAALA